MVLELSSIIYTFTWLVALYDRILFFVTPESMARCSFRVDIRFNDMIAMSRSNWITVHIVDERESDAARREPRQDPSSLLVFSLSSGQRVNFDVEHSDHHQQQQQ